MDGSSYKVMFGGYDKSESKTTDTAPGEAIVSLGFRVDFLDDDGHGPRRGDCEFGV